MQNITLSVTLPVTLTILDATVPTYLVDPPLVPSEANYTIPAGATVVSTQGQLDTALAVGTATDIKVVSGTYSKSGPVTPAAAHRIWCQTASSTLFNYGWNWQYKSGWAMHGGRYTVTDTAHAALDSTRAVILNWFGAPANASGSTVTDVTIDGNRAFEYGIRLGCPDAATVKRVVATNFLDVAVRVSDNTTTSTAIVTEISDLNIANVYRTVRGEADGTAEAGLWIGHRVLNGAARIKVRNTGWMGITPNNKCASTTFSHLDIDETYGTTPSNGNPTGTGIYAERVCSDLIIEKFRIGPNLLTGINGEWHNGTPGNAALNTAEIRYGTITTDRAATYVSGALTGQTYHRCGIYADEGSQNVSVHHVTFRGMTWACLGRYLNVGVPATSSNNYTGRAAGCVTETTAHISSETP